MGERFSPALRLSDLNDFIAPSQSCVVNIGRIQTSDLEPSILKSDRIPHKEYKDFIQAQAKSNTEPVKITLHDCLACSGCITSAETVMLEQQSTSELENKLKSSDCTVIVSLSPQSRAALASYFNISPMQVFQKLTGFLQSLGAAAVFDTSFSRDIALMESCAEFVERYKQSSISNSNSNPESDSSSSMPLPMLASSCPGWICYAEKTHGEYILPYISTTKSPQQIMGSVVKRFVARQLGLRADEIYHVTIMPCYDKKLEASRDDFIMDLNQSHLYDDDDGDESDSGDESEKEDRDKEKENSNYKQEGIGKRNGHGMEEKDNDHLKENGHGDDAIRWNGNGMHEHGVGEGKEKKKGRRKTKKTKKEREEEKKKIVEVDCVLTSEELLDFFAKKEIDFANLPEAPLNKICVNVDEEGHLFGVRGGSDGFAEKIFSFAARTLFEQEIKNEQVEWRVLRNSDFKETFLEVNGKQVLGFACAYGFRNIQNLVRKIKAKKCNYHFVEIMACPGGCLTGGGQIKMKKGILLKDHLLEMERAYLQEVTSALPSSTLLTPSHNHDHHCRPFFSFIHSFIHSFFLFVITKVNMKDPFENPLAKEIYEKWLDHPFSEKSKNILHTSYHHRESSSASKLTNW